MADDLNALVAKFMTNVRSDFDRRMTEFTEDVAKLTSEKPAGLAGLSRQSEWDDLPDLEEIKAIEEYEDFQRRKGDASLSAKYRHLNGAETGKTTAKSIMFSTLLQRGDEVPQSVWRAEVLDAGKSLPAAKQARAALADEGLIDGERGTYYLTTKGWAVAAALGMTDRRDVVVD